MMKKIVLMLALIIKVKRLDSLKMGKMGLIVFLMLFFPFSAFAANVGLLVNGSASWAVNNSGASQRFGSSTPYYVYAGGPATSPLIRETQGTWNEGVMPEAMKASSSARADFGSLGVRSYAYASTGIYGTNELLVDYLDSVGVWRYDALAAATAAFEDTWNIDAGTLNGTTGTLKIGVTLDGSRTPSEYNHSSGLNLSMVNYAKGEANINGIDAGQYLLAIPFTFGVDNNVKMELASSATSGTERFYHGDGWVPSEAGHHVSRGMVTDVNFYDTAWINSLNLFDASGKKITDYTMATASGHDYTFASTSVPEPATMLLFSLGLLGLAGVRRKLKK